MVERIGPKNPLRTHLYLREWREAKKLTQQQLADRIGTTKTTVSRRETWKRDSTVKYLEAIAEALDIGVSDLFRPPGRISVDALLEQAPEETRRKATEVIEVLMKTGT